MRTKYIPAALLMLALAAPLWAGQQHAGSAPNRGPAASRPHNAPARQGAARQQPRNPQGAQVQKQAPAENNHAPAMPRQIIRGQGPHNGDWLRNTMQLPPQEQQKRLEQDQHFKQLPPQRQEQLRNRLQNFNSMPPQQQQRVLNRMEMMEHLKPEQQKQAQALFGQFRNASPERKDVIRRTLRQMRNMPPEARERMLNSPETQSRYSPQEIQMLRGFNDIGFVPGQQP